MQIQNKIQKNLIVRAMRDIKARVVVLSAATKDQGVTAYLTPAQAIKVAAALVKEADFLLRSEKKGKA